MQRNPDCNFDINMFHNDDFVIKKAGDLSKHEEVKEPQGAQFSIKKFKEDNEPQPIKHSPKMKAIKE